MTSLGDHYARLGLPRDATPGEIRRAYHLIARRIHPDVNPDPDSNEEFLRIKAAFETLSQAELRRKYDQQLEPPAIRKPEIISQQYCSRASIPLLSEAQRVYVLLELRPGNQSKTLTGSPLNLCLVLDRSTSMHGRRMDTLKTAAIEIMRKLRPDDILSVVAFSDRAEVILPAGNPHDLNRLESAIHRILTGGATELYQGLEAGLREIRVFLHRQQLAHLILLTDGHTYGDEAVCLELADQAAELGIGISGFGLGEDWNDVFLDDLTSRTGCSAVYISQPETIEAYLVEKFHSLNGVWAKDLRLLLEPHPGVQLRAAYRYEPDPGPLPTGHSILLGYLPGDRSIAILLEFELEPGVKIADQACLASGILQYYPMLNPESIHAHRLNLGTLPAASEPVKTRLNTVLLQAARELNFHRLQENAAAEAARGEIEKAAVRLENLAMQLFQYGAAGLAETSLQEAGELRRDKRTSQGLRLKIKYGTRALMLPGPEKLASSSGRAKL